MKIRSIEDIARLCHQRNKIYCECHGDYSQVDWGEAPQNIRESVIDGVKYVIKNYPFVSSEKSHNNWLKFKEEDGWVYGLEKDFKKKTHPCMIPYHQLPPFHRTKDEIFIKTVLECMGLSVDDLKP